MISTIDTSIGQKRNGKWRGAKSTTIDTSEILTLRGRRGQKRKKVTGRYRTTYFKWQRVTDFEESNYDKKKAKTGQRSRKRKEGKKKGLLRPKAKQNLDVA